MSLSLFNEFFDDILPTPFVYTNVNPQRNVLTRGQRNIPTDFVEKDAYYELHADMPGLTKQDIKIDVDADVITIGVEPAKQEQETKEEEGVKKHRVERSTQYRNRAMRLPENANTEKIDAKYENGVLCLTIPKQEVKEKTKRITIA